MQVKTGILIRNPKGFPIAFVDIKNRQNLSKEAAEEIHQRRMTADEWTLALYAPYFLLLSQDKGYMWNGSEQDKSNDSPTLQFPMDDVVRRYLPTLGANERLRGPELELLVMQWLLDLTMGKPEANKEPEKSLARSDFLDSIKGATALFEAGLDRIY